MKGQPMWPFLLLGALLGSLIPIDGKNLFQAIAESRQTVVAPCGEQLMVGAQEFGVMVVHAMITITVWETMKAILRRVGL